MIPLMLDLKFIRDNLDAVRENTKNRHVTADPDLVVRLYDKRNALLHQLESERASRNANAGKMKGKVAPDERAALIEEGKRLKEAIAVLEKDHEDTEKSLIEEAKKIPNMSHPEAPIAAEEAGNRELRTWGEVPRFPFAPKDHVQLGESLDLIDFEAGARVAGQKFYYLKNQAVFLELALVRYALDILVREGFTPHITPDMAREEIVAGHGFNPRGPESNIYPVEGTDMCLVATAEFTLGGAYAGKILHVNAGHALSLQYHNRKEETILLWSGHLLFEIEKNGAMARIEMKPGDRIHVAPRTVHRMTALQDCEIFEVSTPELDDVVRLEDRYGREDAQRT